MPLQLHEAPDLGAVDPQIGFDVDGRLLDGRQIDAEELGAAVQGRGDRPGQGGIVRFHAGMPGRVDERVFEQQGDEPGEGLGKDTGVVLRST